MRACGARPSEGGPVQGKLALWGKAPRLRGRGFSRRGALCAPVWQGHTHAEAPLGGHGDRVPPKGGGTWRVALRGRRVGKTPSGLRACRARPSEARAFQAKMAWRGKARERGKTAVFWEGRTLCARVAMPHKSRGMSLPEMGSPGGSWPKGAKIWFHLMPSLRACGARPSARGAPRSRPSRGMIGKNARAGFLGGMRSARPQIGPDANRAYENGWGYTS